MSAEKRFLINIVLALAAVGACIFALASFRFDPRLERMLIDSWFRLRGRIEPPSQVILVSIDDESYRSLGVSSFAVFPRKYQAQLLKKLASYGIKGVVFDLVFSGKSLDEPADRELAQAMKLLPVVIASDVVEHDVMTPQGTPGKILERLEPDEIFAKSASQLANMGLPVDSDGIVRHFGSAKLIDGKLEPSLAEAAAQLVSPLATVPKPRDLINFYGPRGSIASMRYHEVLEGDDESLEPIFKDKVVFVGHSQSINTQMAAKDVFATPFGGAKTPGVEVHATAAANLINQNWIRTSLENELMLIFAVVFLLSFAYLALRPQYGILLFAAATVAWAVSSYQAFLAGWYVPGVIPMLIVTPAVFLLSTFVFYISFYRAERRVREMFSHYLAPELVEQMARERSAVKLGGEKVKATLFFSDVAGFTTISETTDPEQLVAALNRYFNVIGDAVLAEGATLIKFIGDGLFALWGAPMAIDDGEVRAVRCALAIQKKVAELSREANMPQFETRVGIYWGDVVVGNLGSNKRFDYTAIGDAVNVASRLEWINKEFGTSILIGGAAALKVRDKFPVLKLCAGQVPGKRELIDIYTVFEERLDEDIPSLWEEACLFFAQKQWDKSEQFFRTISERDSRLKKAVMRHLRDIALYRVTAPRDGWQGELVFTKGQ